MKTVIVDERISKELLRSLLILGFSPILLPKFPMLNEAVCSHPDTLFFRDKNEIYVSADYCEYAPYVLSDLRERHPNIKVNFTSDILLAEYPCDCAFNALLLGNKLFCRLKSISDSVCEHAKKNSYKIINTNQKTSYFKPLNRKENNNMPDNTNTINQKGACSLMENFFAIKHPKLAKKIANNMNYKSNENIITTCNITKWGLSKILKQKVISYAEHLKKEVD